MIKNLFLASAYSLAIAHMIPAQQAEAKPRKSQAQSGRTADGKPDYYEKIYTQTIEGKSKEEYFTAINGGWAKNLSPLRSALNPEKNYLVIHTIEPQNVLDLRSAEKFKQGMMSKGVLNMGHSTLGIGHVFLSWRCQVGGEMKEGTVGMTGELSNQFKEMIDNGWGLSTFLANFEDGHLQTPALLDFEFENADPVHTLAVEVDPSVCGNALNFVNEFLNHEDEPYTVFGLQADPTKFEGGGCGSFGTTIIEKSKLFEDIPVTQNFWRTIHGRSSLFGYGNELPEDSLPFDLGLEGQKKVSVMKLFLLSNWDAGRDGGHKIRFMDPELLLLFLKTVYRSFLGDAYSADARLGKELMYSQIYRYRVTIQNSFTINPSGSNESWAVTRTGEQPIDANFDEKSARAVAQGRSWSNRLKGRGYHATPVVIGTGSHRNMALVLSR